MLPHELGVPRKFNVANVLANALLTEEDDDELELLLELAVQLATLVTVIA